MSDPPKVAAARIEVERTRAALLETTRELQQRLQPRSLANDVWEKAKDKGADLAEGAVDAVAKRPIAVGGVVAALAMFLAREPLKAATIKFYDAMTPLFEPRSKAVALKEKKGARPVSSKVERPARQPTRRPAQSRTSRRSPQKKTEKA